jgi:hypothetical protein
MGLGPSSTAPENAAGVPSEEQLRLGVQQMPTDHKELLVIQQHVLDTLQRIYSRQQRVNVVFSAPVGAGCEEYAMRFAQWTGARYVHDIQQRFKVNTDMLAQARSKALENLKDPYQALMFHVTDYLAKAYLHLPELKNTAGGASDRGLYVYAGSALDDMNAMVLASVDLNQLAVPALNILELIGAFVWKLQTQSCLPSYTIFVYIKYSDAHHREAFGAFLEANGLSTSLPRVSSGGSIVADEPNPLQAHAAASKKHMDNFYRQHAMNQHYITSVLDCEDRVLLSPPHGAFICREVLWMVEELQQRRIWGASDEARIEYLRHSYWAGRRVRAVPLHIVPHSSPASFSHNAPFPVTAHPRTASTEPVAVSVQPAGISSSILSREKSPGARRKGSAVGFQDPRPVVLRQ